MQGCAISGNLSEAICGKKPVPEHSSLLILGLWPGSHCLLRLGVYHRSLGTDDMP
uniref:Uncharacterized protein n=1 Tax=Anguilla anguilla TaxID=7936 RepID=A0A0E9TQ52_ANGAN